MGPVTDDKLRTVDLQESATDEFLSNRVVGWRVPIISYLQEPSQKTDKAIRRLALKFTLVDGDLYRRIADGLLLKCLDEDQSRVAMGEVHDGLCGTHQSAHKMKWLL